MTLPRFNVYLGGADFYNGKLGSDEKTIKEYQEKSEKNVKYHIKAKGRRKTALK
jgi:hypothetical protein